MYVVPCITLYFHIGIGCTTHQGERDALLFARRSANLTLASIFFFPLHPCLAFIHKFLTHIFISAGRSKMLQFFLLFCERNRSECDLPQGLYRTVSKGSNKKSKNLKKLQTRPSSEQIPWRQCCLRSYGRQCLMFTPLLHMPGGTCHPDLYQRIRREDWKITLRLLLRFVHCCTLSLRWSS